MEQHNRCSDDRLAWGTKTELGLDKPTFTTFEEKKTSGNDFRFTVASKKQLSTQAGWLSVWLDALRDPMLHREHRFLC